MRALRDANGLPGTAIRDEHLHVTLCWFGYDCSDSGGLIAGSRASAGVVVAAPFRVVFNQLVGATASLLLVPSEPLAQLGAFQHQLTV